MNHKPQIAKCFTNKPQARIFLRQPKDAHPTTKNASTHSESTATNSSWLPFRQANLFCLPMAYQSADWQAIGRQGKLGGPKRSLLLFAKVEEVGRRSRKGVVVVVGMNKKVLNCPKMYCFRKVRVVWFG